MPAKETRSRYSLFGTQRSIHEARSAAAEVFGDIFQLRDSDYCGDYWLGYWHGEPFDGDEIIIRPNREWDELYEDAFPQFETLLYVAASNPAVEEAIVHQGFEPLRVTEIRLDEHSGEKPEFIGQDTIFEATAPQ